MFLFAKFRFPIRTGSVADTQTFKCEQPEVDSNAYHCMAKHECMHRCHRHVFVLLGNFRSHLFALFLERLQLVLQNTDVAIEQSDLFLAHVVPQGLLDGFQGHILDLIQLQLRFDLTRRACVQAGLRALSRPEVSQRT